MDYLVVIVDVAVATGVSSCGRSDLVSELAGRVLEVVLGTFWQLCVVVHVDCTVDIFIVDVGWDVTEGILLVDVFLARYWSRYSLMASRAPSNFSSSASFGF